MERRSGLRMVKELGGKAPRLDRLSVRISHGPVLIR